ncbi:hypothetical protein [Nocardia camponoti]|uniref:hypothetical protein n=1 Tax=Nocardia camponoti TaxID=1616106 RepID=UPI0016692803|nr:hypothetical protein [Nocardia camponoti]
MIVSAGGSVRSGVLGFDGKSLDQVIDDHLAHIAHINREIADAELGEAQLLAIAAYDAQVAQVSDLRGQEIVDDEVRDYADYILLVLRTAKPNPSARRLLAHFDSLLAERDPRRRQYTHPCPHCGRITGLSERYSRAVCARCVDHMTDGSGRPVRVFNASLSGGRIAYFVPHVASHTTLDECVEVTKSGVAYLADGTPVTVNEARFVASSRN